MAPCSTATSDRSTSSPRPSGSAPCACRCSPTPTASRTSRASTTTWRRRCSTAPSTAGSTTSTPPGCTTRTTARRGSARRCKGGYRERVRIATKMPVWNVEKPVGLRPHPGHPARAAADRPHRLLPAALARRGHWQTVLEHGQLASAERALADGRIGHLGFSFHGAYEDFETILAATDLWEFVQIQYNYMDEDYQAGRKGLELAAGKGLGVIVMEPVRGGALARNLPPQVQAVWDEAPIRRSPAEWALQWVWSHPEVSFLLSGMSTMEHVEDNLRFAGPVAAGPADGGGARAGGARARPVPRAQPDPVHLVPLLHAVPAGRRHPRRLRALQRRPHVRQPAAPADGVPGVLRRRTSAPTAAPPAASASRSARRASTCPPGSRRPRRSSPPADALGPRLASASSRTFQLTLPGGMLRAQG